VEVEGEVRWDRPERFAIKLLNFELLNFTLGKGTARKFNPKSTKQRVVRCRCEAQMCFVHRNLGPRVGRAYGADDDHTHDFKINVAFSPMSRTISGRVPRQRQKRPAISGSLSITVSSIASTSRTLYAPQCPSLHIPPPFCLFVSLLNPLSPPPHQMSAGSLSLVGLCVLECSS
jgi:hypothetical protein